MDDNISPYTLNLTPCTSLYPLTSELCFPVPFTNNQ